MKLQIIKTTIFKPCKCRESEVIGAQGFLNHLKIKQQDYIFHRADLLCYYDLRDLSDMVQYGNPSGYKIGNEHRQIELNKNKLHYAL